MKVINTILNNSLQVTLSINPAGNKIIFYFCLPKCVNKNTEINVLLIEVCMYKIKYNKKIILNFCHCGQQYSFNSI